MAVTQSRTGLEAAAGRIAAASLLVFCLGAAAQEGEGADAAGSKDDEAQSTKTGSEIRDAASPDAAEVDKRRDTSLVSRMVLKVVHPEQVRRTLIEVAESFGGFPIFITDARLTLKVPPEKLSEMIEAAEQEGHVVEKTLERQDLTARIAVLEGRVRSKSDILRRLREFFADSEISATLRVEQSMSSLVAELERVKGQLRVAREQARHAVVDVSFRFPKRDRIIYVDSPFEWINTVDLDRFLREF